MRAWRQFFVLFILFRCTRVCDSVCASHGGYFEMFNMLAGFSELRVFKRVRAGGKIKNVNLTNGLWTYGRDRKNSKNRTKEQR